MMHSDTCSCRNHSDNCPCWDCTSCFFGRKDISMTGWLNKQDLDFKSLTEENFKLKTDFFNLMVECAKEKVRADTNHQLWQDSLSKAQDQAKQDGNTIADLRGQLSLSDAEIQILRKQVQIPPPLPQSLVEAAVSRTALESRALGTAVKQAVSLTATEGCALAKQSWSPIKTSLSWMQLSLLHLILQLQFSYQIGKNRFQVFHAWITLARNWFNDDCPRVYPRFAALFLSFLLVAYLSPLVSFGYIGSLTLQTQMQQWDNDAIVIPPAATPEHDRLVAAQKKAATEQVLAEKHAAEEREKTLETARKNLATNYQKWQEQNQHNLEAAQPKPAVVKPLSYQEIEQRWFMISNRTCYQLSGRPSAAEIREAREYERERLIQMIETVHPALLKDYYRLMGTAGRWPQNSLREITDREIAVINDVLNRGGTEWEAVQEAQQAYRTLPVKVKVWK